LDFEPEFELVVITLKSLIKILNSVFEVAHGLEEGRSSSLIGHLDKIHDTHFF